MVEFVFVRQIVHIRNCLFPPVDAFTLVLVHVVAAALLIVFVCLRLSCDQWRIFALKRTTFDLLK